MTGIAEELKRLVLELLVRTQWKTAKARSHLLLKPKALIMPKISEAGWGWSESKGIKPDVFTYTTLLSGFEKAGKDDFAIQVFLEMRAVGCKPNICTFNALIKMHGNRGKFAEMMKAKRKERKFPIKEWEKAKRKERKFPTKEWEKVKKGRKESS